MAGRKSLKEEVGVLRRYQDLTPGYFKILKKRMKSGNKKDENWAVEQLTKAYTKMIPQQVGGLDGKPIEVQWLSSQSITPRAAGPNDYTPQVHAG